MSDAMYFNLAKLSTGKFGVFDKNKGLERELYHLRTIGYINCESIQSIPKKGNNLSEFVTIASTGKQFVELRQNIIDMKNQFLQKSN